MSVTISLYCNPKNSNCSCGMITPPQIVNMPVLAHDFLHILIRYIGCFLFHFSPPKNLKNILKTAWHEPYKIVPCC